MLEPKYELAFSSNIWSGFGFGISQFSTFTIFALLFFLGGLIIEKEFPNIDSEKVFMALFCIMFGAS